MKKKSPGFFIPANRMKIMDEQKQNKKKTIQEITLKEHYENI